MSSSDTIISLINRSAEEGFLALSEFFTPTTCPENNLGVSE
jgi:hypothetical protein